MFEKEELLTLYVNNVAEDEARVNLQKYVANGTGTLITLSTILTNPNITINKSETKRTINAYTGVYRKDDTVRFCEYDGADTISNSNGKWEILLIPNPSDPKLYLLDEGRLVFFPEETISTNNADFLEVYYKTPYYQGMIRLYYTNGKQSVFSETNTNHYGTIYGQTISSMASLAVDINALQTLTSLPQLNISQKIQTGEEINLW